MFQKIVYILAEGQRAKSIAQRAKSKEQRAKSKEQENFLTLCNYEFNSLHFVILSPERSEGTEGSLLFAQKRFFAFAQNDKNQLHNYLCPMLYALCPMPYALCPMPYALCQNVN